MRTFKASHYDSRDFSNDDTFTFELPNARKAGVARVGYILDCAEDGMFLMQKSSILKSHYTEQDHTNQARLNAMEPVKTGDIVLVDGKQYLVTIKGDYSDAGRLTPVNV